MFERFTEKARRVIFFARYEASQYGSRYIDTEHLLLALFREGPSLMRQVLGPSMEPQQIRAEIEKVITKGERIATAAEVPLSLDVKNALTIAFEECDESGTGFVEMEHLLLGILRVDDCLAARILKQKGVELATVRALLRTSLKTSSAQVKLLAPKIRPGTIEGVAAAVHNFAAQLKSTNSAELSLLFASVAQIVDSTGARWRGRDEIEKGSRQLFAAYASANVTSLVQGVDYGPHQTFVASVLWESANMEAGQSTWKHRMTLVLGQEGEDWVVFLLQVTPINAG